MKASIFVRPFTNEERQHIQAGLRSSDAFAVRRCQILLASARGERAIAIAQQLSYDDQTVRNVIKQFNTDGVGVLQAGSSHPHRLRTVMDAHLSRVTREFHMHRHGAPNQPEHLALGRSRKELVYTQGKKECLAQRAKLEVDYKHHGKGYVFGAFCPHTGEVFTDCYTRRLTVNWIDFLEQVDTWIDPQVKSIYAVIDNLGMRKRDTCIVICSLSSSLGICLSTDSCSLS